MEEAIRQSVRRRSGFRCEYCGILEQSLPFAAFHIDHIVARQHGGGDGDENLAWSCHECNLYKGPNLSSVDPDTSEVVRIFHPRNQIWNEHFVIKGDFIRGRTATGRATVWVLQFNSAERLELRAAIREGGGV